MALKKPISFKDDEKDIYDFLLSHKYFSAYMKNLIRKDMEESKVKDTKTVKTQENNNFNLDF